MTHGRPAMVAGFCDIPSPSIIDDEYLRGDGEGTQPTDIPSRMHLFVHSLRLADIMEEILTVFYQNQGGMLHSESNQLDFGSHEGLSQVLRIESELNEWMKTLPDFLRAKGLAKYSGQSYYNRLSLQSNIFRNRYVDITTPRINGVKLCFLTYPRYLHVRILLLRPILMNSILRSGQIGEKQNKEENGSLQDALIARACNACVEASQQLLDNLYDHLDSEYRSHVWHGVYCTGPFSLSR
jgi:hypothetical protein